MKQYRFLAASFLLTTPVFLDATTTYQPETFFTETGRSKLREKIPSEKKLDSKVFSIELKNGERLPVHIKQQNIRLSNGWEEFDVKTDNIQEIAFDKGVFSGKIEKDGEVKELDSAWVKDKGLKVLPLNSQNPQEIPWENILSVVFIGGQDLAGKNEKQVEAKKKQMQQIVLQLQKIKSFLEERDALFKKLSDNSQNPVQEKTKSFDAKERLLSLQKKTKSYESELAKVSQALAVLKSNQGQQRGEAKEVKVLQKRLSEEKDLNAALKGQLASFVEQQGTIYQRKLDLLKDAFSEKSKEIRALKSDQANLYHALFYQVEALRQEKREWQKEKELLESDVEKMQAKILQYENKLRDVIGFFGEKSQNFESLMGSQAKIHQELLAKIGDLSEKNQGLKEAKELTESEKQELQEGMETLHQEKQKWQEEKKQLEEAAAEMQASILQSENKLKDLIGFFDEKSQNFESLMGSQLKTQQNLLAKIEHFSEKNEELKAAKELTESEKQELQKGMLTLHQQIEALHQEREEWQKEKGQLEEAAAKMQENILQYENKLKDLRAFFSEKSQNFESLMKSQLKVQQELLEKIEYLLEKNKELKAAKELTESEKEELQVGMLNLYEQWENEKQEKEQALSKASDFGEKLVDLEKEKAELGEHLAFANEGTKRLQEALNQKIILHQKDLEDFSNKEKELIAEIDELKGNIRSAHSDLLGVKESQKDALSQKEKAEKTIEKVMEKIADKEKELQLQKEALREKEEAFKKFGENAAAQQEKLSQRIVELLNDSKQKEMQLEELEKELAKEKENFLKAGGELNQLAKTHQNMQDAALAEKEALIKLNKEKEAQIVSFEESVVQLLKENKIKTEELTSLQEKLKQSQKTIEKFKSQLEGAKKSLASKQSEVETLNISQHGLRNSFLEESGLLKSRLQQEADKADSIKAHLTALLPELEQERKRNKQLENEIKGLSDKLFHTTKSMIGREEDKKALNEKLSSFIKANQKLSEETEFLSEQLKNEREETSKQRESVKKLKESLENQKAALTKIEKTHSNFLLELENVRKKQKLFSSEGSSEKAAKSARSSSYSEGTKKLGKKVIHTVAGGENLNNISMKYYGTPYRWVDIYEANNKVIPDVNRIKAGTILIIPD